MDLDPFVADLVDHDDEPVYLPIQINGMVVDKFRINTRVSSMPLLEFAHAAKSGLDSEQADGLAAMRGMIHDCLWDEAEWGRFKTCAMTHRLTGDHIMQICRQVWEAIAARPTNGSSASSPGEPTHNGGHSSASNATRGSTKSAAQVTRGAGST